MKKGGIGRVKKQGGLSLRVVFRHLFRHRPASRAFRAVAMSKTIASCLASLGISSPSALADAADLASEWAAIKRSYFKTALRAHPDKGGDAAAFRDVQVAFEALRSIYDTASPAYRFSMAANQPTAKSPLDGLMNTPSWEYYAEAAQETVPMYRVERAKSNRSRCMAKGNARSAMCLKDDCIEKDELRVGWMNMESGSYQNWVHLKCWRVPNRVWLGLPDPAKCQDVHVFAVALKCMGAVLLSGLGELSDGELRAVVRFCMNKANWARKVDLKDRNAIASSADASSSGSSSAVAKAGRTSGPSSSSGGAGPSLALVPAAVAASGVGSSSDKLVASNRFRIPVPGRDGRPNSLAGKTIVLSGIFPEVGGGAGLSLGKERTTAMLISFGGRVTSSVSGKTDVLLVGKEPGYAKVSQAQAQGCALLSLHDVAQGLVRGSIEDVMRVRRKTPLEIDSFSAGFRGNGLALKLGHRRAAELRAGYCGPSPSSARPGPKPAATTPSTTAIVPKTASVSVAKPAVTTAEAPKAIKEKVNPSYTAAPLETIDVSQLKPTRFLLPPAALPYRDEGGRVSLHLLRDSVAKVEAGAISPPEEVEKTLRKWLKHAEKEVAKGGHEWTELLDGTWQGPEGEVREVVTSNGGQTDEEDDEPDDEDDEPDDEDDEPDGEQREQREVLSDEWKRSAAELEGESATENEVAKRQCVAPAATMCK